jgi:dynein heavy chain
VAAAHKAVFRAGKAFAQRGAGQLAASCDTVRADIEGFRALVPLVQVGLAGAGAWQP